MLTISREGLDAIKKEESCVLTAYKDPLSKTGLPITIGYGSTMYQDGRRIMLGDKITQQQADELLMWGLQKRSTVINNLGLRLTQNQFDAVLSLCYNIGVGAFADSTLKKLIRMNPTDPAIEAEWLRWKHVGGVPSPGLLARRKREYERYSRK